MPTPESDRAANELVRDVARMVSDWETSDELASDLAARIVGQVSKKLRDEPFRDIRRTES